MTQRTILDLKLICKTCKIPMDISSRKISPTGNVNYLLYSITFECSKCLNKEFVIIK
jgi:hypothetical protein